MSRPGILTALKVMRGIKEFSYSEQPGNYKPVFEVRKEENGTFGLWRNSAPHPETMTRIAVFEDEDDADVTEMAWLFFLHSFRRAEQIIKERETGETIERAGG